MLHSHSNTAKAVFVICILFIFEFMQILVETCEKIDDCSRRKSNGKVINLRAIDGGSKGPATVKITLKCDASRYPGGTDGVTEEYQPKNSAYSMTVISKCACDDGCVSDNPSGSESFGLSTGSILLIAFFLLIFAYLIGGIVIKKYKMGVESMPEMVPNYEFWAGMPSPVKDGIVSGQKLVRSGQKLSNTL